MIVVRHQIYLHTNYNFDLINVNTYAMISVFMPRGYYKNIWWHKWKKHAWQSQFAESSVLHESACVLVLAVSIKLASKVKEH